MIHEGDKVYKRGTNPYEKGNIGVADRIVCWETVGEMFQARQIPIFAVKFWDRTEEIPVSGLKKAPMTVKMRE